MLQYLKINKTRDFRHADNLPYIYGMWKVHKQSFRWIAGSCRRNLRTQPVDTESTASFNRTTAASKRLSCLLSQVIYSLQRHSEMEQLHSGFRYCWITRVIDEVATKLRVSSQQFRGRHPRTFDFTTMYTQLPHDRLKVNVMTAVRKAFTFESECRARNRRDDDVVLEWVDQINDAKWEVRRRALFYTVNDIRELVDFVVDIVYVCNGSFLRQQVVGIPMV